MGGDGDGGGDDGWVLFADFLHKTKYEFDEWVGMVVVVVMMVGVVDDVVIVLAPI
jgi:hypothetical protein